MPQEFIETDDLNMQFSNTGERMFAVYSLTALDKLVQEKCVCPDITLSSYLTWI